MVITVRRANLEDLSGFRSVGFVTWPPTYEPVAGTAYVRDNLDVYWSEDALRPTIEAGNALVAEAGPVIVGVSEVGDWGDDLSMWKLYVLPGWQGQGVGTLLLNAVIGIAAERNRPLITEYLAANSAAGDFYERRGFVRESEPTGPLSPVWMRLTTAHPGEG